MDSTRSLAPPFLPHSFPPRSTRYPGYQLIIRLFSIIDRRNRSIVHLPSLSALFESHPHLDSINVSLREINLSYIGLMHRRQCPIAKHGAVTQNGLRQGWPPLFALAIFISSTPCRQDITHLLRMEFSSDSTGKNRGVSQKTMPSYRQITTTSSSPHAAPGNSQN